MIYYAWQLDKEGITELQQKGVTYATKPKTD